LTDSSEHSAWNPGLSSQIPVALQPQITLFRSESTDLKYSEVKELADFCGLNAAEIVPFRIERLIIHELLIRVTSDLSVPDGPNYEDLGISLRSMVRTIYEHNASNEIPRLKQIYDKRLSEAQQYIEKQVFTELVVENKGTRPTFLQRLFKNSSKKKKSSEPREFTALAAWQRQIESEKDAHKLLGLGSLIKTVNAIISHRGRVFRQTEIITRIATHCVANDIGQDVVAENIEPIIDTAIKVEGYKRLPIQNKPLVMNVKGASASGKSTIRPQQRELADKLGVAWEDFALISPDYWRKYLLDYDSLGDNYKYAAMLTGQELELIDKKLDRYMAQKARAGQIPHLLIDRFRFDSFSVEKGRSQDSRLLSRFGDRIFMFFMITSPSETVERAWLRGQTTGRFKAVDDLLFHNVEAFTGMPELFLSWVMSGDKQVHFEFLNNDVSKGQLPKTAAFGWNESMTILDLSLIQDVDRFRKVNVDAKHPDQVLETKDESASNTKFIARCIRSIKQVRFAEADTGKVIVEFENGKLVFVDVPRLKQQSDAEHLSQLIEGHAKETGSTVEDIDTDEEKKYTLGSWNNDKVPRNR